MKQCAQVMRWQADGNSPDMCQKLMTLSSLDSGWRLIGVVIRKTREPCQDILNAKGVEYTSRCSEYMSLH